MKTITKRTYVLTGLVLASLTAGCSELVRSRLQSEIDTIWSNPTRKAAAESTVRTKLKAELDEALVGESFEVPGPNPYLHHIKSFSVRVGDFGPKIKVPTEPRFWQTSSHYYLAFDWRADWTKWNRAKIDMGLDLRTHKWWMANEYPDHTVKIRDITAGGHGTALVMMAKSGGKAVASFTVQGAHVDLDADAKGWFWTIDISKQIKGKINDQLLRQLVGKAIEYGFNADIPGIG